MKDVMGIIYTGEKDSFLRELTLLRAVAAIPVAGRYRLIDFPVSGMVNSGIKNIGVIMQKNYHSLMDHLGSGKEWDLHGKSEGLHILPPYLTRENVGVYGGTLDALASNMNYLHRSHQEYVLFTNSLIFYNPDYNDMFDAFIKTKCDIMMLYSRDPRMQRPEFGIYMDVAEDGRVVGMEADPTHPRYECTGMDTLLIRRDLLIDLVDDGMARGYHEFVKDVVLKLARDSGLNVYGFEYKEECRRVDSITSYYKLNMDLLDTEIRNRFFPEDRPVYTKVRDELPARYMESSLVTDSLVANGSVINGMVDHSVLFRGVRIEKGACVKNCVIMQDCVISEGVQLENCILDKQSVIKDTPRLIGPKGYPIVITKNTVI